MGLIWGQSLSSTATRLALMIRKSLKSTAKAK
jgi:hypothetical protein